MFRFKPEAFYMMPFHFGPRAGKGSAVYREVTTLTVTYLTDRELLAEYLPEPFTVGPEPLVSVSYAQNRGVEWLAGGGYNLIGVNGSAVFQGEKDRLSGSYCLVMWENLTDPILTGREIQGIPKVYADIPDHTVVDGVWRACASLRGHKIVDLTLRGLQPLSTVEVKALEKSAREGNWMGWKYIPKTGGPGAEISEATLFPTSPTFEKGWIGSGEVVWNRLTWEQNPTQFHIVNALERLPILEYRWAGVLIGSSDLMVPERPVRPLQ